MIAELAGRTGAPDPHTIMTCTGKHTAHLGKKAVAERQNVAMAANTYFRYLPLPGEWTFIGAERYLGLGRIDLLWQHQDGRLVIDEIKTGAPRQLRLSATQTQAGRYLSTAARLWTPRLAGLRLLSTTRVRDSLFFPSDGGAAVALTTTPYLRST